MDNRTIRVDGTGTRHPEHTVKIRKCIRTGRTRRSSRITEITRMHISSRITETVRTHISSRITETARTHISSRITETARIRISSRITETARTRISSRIMETGRGIPTRRSSTVRYPMFCAIFFMAQIIINFVVFGATWNAMAGEGIDAYLDGSVSLGSPVQMLSMFSNLLFVAMLVLLILDIVKISNQKYKITGLVLFAIFLRPGYYVWRAHVLKRKMTFPIIYTIVYSGVTVAYFFYSFYKVFSLTFGIMQSLN